MEFDVIYIYYRNNVMNSSELLKADLLDILFEGRNKQYGAYILRRYYPNRLGLALILTLGSALLFFFYY